VRVGIIGAGAVGSSIGTALARAGHTVRLRVRDPARHTQLASELGGCSA